VRIFTLRDKISSHPTVLYFGVQLGPSFLKLDGIQTETDKYLKKEVLYFLQNVETLPYI
jgi:hypothetical protein